MKIVKMSVRYLNFHILKTHVINGFRRPYNKVYVMCTEPEPG